MTKTKLNEYRRALLTKQGELGSGDRSREVISIDSSSDEMDRIQHALERDYAIDKLERNSSRLNEVRAALRRIEEDSYGVCLACEEEINPRRLAAVPWTAYCITCQEAADLEESKAWNESERTFAATA